MKRNTPRGLHPDEKELWDRIARSTNPLHKNRPAASVSQPPNLTLKSEDQTKPEPIAPFRVGSKSATAISTAGVIGQSHQAPLRMDKNAFRKLKRGKSAPDARIDLHGLSADSAKSSLTGFILRAHGEGKRLVLVITGKGRGSGGTGPVPERVGVLRREVPIWLSRPPLSPLVLQVTEAHQRHGGSGAYYVYLKRR